MRLTNQDQILVEDIRKKIIEEISQPENVQRKQEFLKRYEVYKDQTKKYVLKGLKDEGLREETIAQMSNRAGNISICRKIVNKKARAYSGGVQRQTENNDVQNQINELGRLLSFDQRMKKGDRYTELHKNAQLLIVPELEDDSDVEAKKYRLKFSVLAPWKYDVVEDYYDRECPLVVIISDFSDGATAGLASSSSQAGYHSAGGVGASTGDGKDQIIADTPMDAGLGEKKEYVWWSDAYHFTTDENGTIIRSPEDLKNPIGMMPLVNNAQEQDGQFWAVGGDDLVDGSILVNKQLTDMNYIAYLQGYGQPVITGKNLKNERFRFGPNNAIILEYDPSTEEPQPTVEFASANPPLESWMRMVEQYVALLLTTNNLSPSNVSGQLSAQTFPSGIAIMIEQSESTDNVVDKQRAYVEIERELWEITKRWHNLYFSRNLLCDEFMQVGKLPEQLDISVKFMEVKPPITEAERLANIKARKDLGINEQVDLILLDNPDMTRDEAEQKLKKIIEEKLRSIPTPVAQDQTKAQSAGGAA